MEGSNTSQSSGSTGGAYAYGKAGGSSSGGSGMPDVRRSMSGYHSTADRLVAPGGLSTSPTRSQWTVASRDLFRDTGLTVKVGSNDLAKSVVRRVYESPR